TTQTASVIQGLTYPISIGFQYGGIGLYFDVFIDWDNNGTLTDPGEVYNIGGPFSSGPVTGNIVVPINAVPGTTRMRVVMRTGTSFTMCNTTNGGYGEVEDYSIIVIANTPCSGTPTAGTAAVNTRACSSEPVNLTLTGSTLAGGITYQWQSSPQGAGTFTDMTGATSVNHIVTNQTVATDYRCVVTCTNSNSSSTSNVVTATQPAAITTNFYEDFDSTPSGNSNNNTVPNCWTYLKTGSS